MDARIHASIKGRITKERLRTYGLLRRWNTELNSVVPDNIDGAVMSICHKRNNPFCADVRFILRHAWQPYAADDCKTLSNADVIGRNHFYWPVLIHCPCMFAVLCWIWTGIYFILYRNVPCKLGSFQVPLTSLGHVQQLRNSIVLYCIVLYCILLLYTLTERNLYYIQVALPTWCIYKVHVFGYIDCKNTIQAINIRPNPKICSFSRVLI